MIVASNLQFCHAYRAYHLCSRALVTSFHGRGPFFSRAEIYLEILDTFDTPFILLGIVSLTLFTVSPTTTRS